MTTLHTLLETLRVQIEGVTQGVIADGAALQVKSGIGWPPVSEIMNVARGPSSLALITVYDRKISRNTTRWLPLTLGEVVAPSTLASTVSSPTINPAGTVTVTLGASVSANDAVSIVVQKFGLGGAAGGVVIGGSAGQGLASIASALAAAVNGDPVLSTLVSAAAAGPVVTLTSLFSGAPLLVSSYTGNSAGRTREIGRRNRQIQIVSWTRTEGARQAVTDPIDALIQQLALNFGLTFPDGSMGRLVYSNDFYIEQATVEDVLRRDFIITVDYPITVQDTLYAVLAPIPAFQAA